MRPDEAIQKLLTGNQRFLQDVRCIHSLASQQRRETLAKYGQNPFAAILCCSDARVPAEMIFDAGLGDLFVTRVAGNTINSAVLASLEFAVLNFHVPVIVIMGHTECGLVRAAVDRFHNKTSLPSPHLEALVEQLDPVIAMKSPLQNLGTHHEQCRAVTAENCYHGVEQVLEQSKILRDLVATDNLAIISGVYDLSSGQFDLHEVPSPLNRRDFLAESLHVRSRVHEN